MTRVMCGVEACPDFADWRTNGLADDISTIIPAVSRVTYVEESDEGMGDAVT
jgi:hypothetical protein